MIGALFVFGMALFSTYPATLSFVGSSVEPRNRTAAFSLASNTMILGNSLFSFLSGKISDSFGINAPFLLLAAMAVAVMTYLAVMVRTGKIPAAGCRLAPRVDPQ